MGNIVSSDFQKAAAEALAVATSVIEGVDAEVAERSSGTNPRHVVVINALPGSWRTLAENLYSEHAVDYCSMVTGIHWPDGDEEKKWEVVYHLMRTGVRDPPIENGIVRPIIVNPSKLRGGQYPSRD